MLVPLLAPVLALVIANVGCKGRSQKEPSAATLLVDDDTPHVTVVDLATGLPERAAGGLFAGGGSTFSEVMLALKDVKDTEESRGVFVRFGGASVALAQAQELGRALASLRESGRRVTCHGHGFTNATMMLAAAGCDDIWLSPAGSVETIGVAAQMIFGRELLEKLKVDVDFLQVGKFKGASEPFTRDSASDEHKASMRTMLSALEGTLLQTIQTGRALTDDGKIIRDGPYTAKRAQALKLIDHIGFEREALSAAITEGKAEGRRPLLATTDAGGERGLLVRLFTDPSGPGVPHVAILQLTGGIQMSGGGGLGGGSGISYAADAKTIRALRDDESVHAVVLRLDSPGGSALASDLLWHELTELRKVKPLITSVGSMAASGGYYLSCAANEVFAEETSIIGSIGVVAGKLSFHRSLAEVGVHVEVITADPDADAARPTYGSPFTPWDEATRARLTESMEETYALFLKRIATGRDLKESDIAPVAEGRVMGGLLAKEAGLVTTIGGVLDAVARAKALAKLEPDAPVRVVAGPSGLLALLGGGDGSVKMPEAKTSVLPALIEVATSPYQAETTDFLNAITPLIRGERVLAVSPLILRVR